MPEAAHTSYADRIMIAMGAERDALGLIGGNPMPVEARDRVLNSMTAIFIQEALKAAKPPKKAKVADLSDEEWIRSLESDEAFKGLNVRAEIARCSAWYRQNISKVGGPTRRRILNWLLKCERVMDLKSAGAQHATGLKLPPPPGPPNWKVWAETELATMSEEAPGYGQVLTAIRCVNFNLMPLSFRERCQRQSA